MGYSAEFRSNLLPLCNFMKKHLLTLCAVVKNEGSYIEEWIKYHLSLNVKHFYLYDNGSTDGTLDIIKPYVQEGQVTLIEMLDTPVQFKAYNHCLEHYGHEADWIGFLDIDEFLAGDVLFLDWILRMCAPSLVGAVALSWKFFGSNGDVNRKLYPVRERFIRSQEGLDKHVKSIVKPESCISVGNNPHYFKLKEGYKYINTLMSKLPNDFQGLIYDEASKHGSVYIAHYHTKSYEEYIERKTTKPDPGTNRFKENVEESFRIHDLNEVLNLDLLR